MANSVILCSAAVCSSPVQQPGTKCIKKLEHDGSARVGSKFYENSWEGRKTTGDVMCITSWLQTEINQTAEHETSIIIYHSFSISFLVSWGVQTCGLSASQHISHHPLRIHNGWWKICWEFLRMQQDHRFAPSRILSIFSTIRCGFMNLAHAGCSRKGLQKLQFSDCSWTNNFFVLNSIIVDLWFCAQMHAMYFQPHMM